MKVKGINPYSFGRTSARLFSVVQEWRVKQTSMRHIQSIAMLFLLFTLSFLALCCKREERGFRVSPPQAETINSKSLSDLQPGPKTPSPEIHNEYEENAYAMSEGKNLFEQYNCSGCHAHGGGSIGPPLMDDQWNYGSQPQNIFATIVEGRPNGMPSFRGRIPDYQVWQLVAFVRSMGRYVPKDAAPSRDDHLQGKPAEASTERGVPKNSSRPKSVEMPQ
jgi:cytochrome c oxidase cbb3-type subunit 3